MDKKKQEPQNSAWDIPVSSIVLSGRPSVDLILFALTSSLVSFHCTVQSTTRLKILFVVGYRLPCPYLKNSRRNNRKKKTLLGRRLIIISAWRSKVARYRPIYRDLIINPNLFCYLIQKLNRFSSSFFLGCKERKKLVDQSIITWLTLMACMQHLLNKE